MAIAYHADLHFHHAYQAEVMRYLIEGEGVLMHYLVLLEKFTPVSDCWPQLLRTNATSYGMDTVIHKYNGFEGETVSVHSVGTDIVKYKKCLNECFQLKKMSDCLLLHVVTADRDNEDFCGKESSQFMGFDIGNCEEDATLYSSIFNEALFGGYDELIAYNGLLNEALLISDKAIAQSYVDLHNRMSSEGKNVEDYMEMKIYQIWKHE